MLANSNNNSNKRQIQYSDDSNGSQKRIKFNNDNEDDITDGEPSQNVLFGLIFNM